MRNNKVTIVFAIVLSFAFLLISFLYLSNVPTLVGVIILVLLNFTIPYGYLIYETIQYVQVKPREVTRFLFFSVFCATNLSGSVLLLLYFIVS